MKDGEEDADSDDGTTNKKDNLNSKPADDNEGTRRQATDNDHDQPPAGGRGGRGTKDENHDPAAAPKSGGGSKNTDENPSEDNLQDRPESRDSADGEGADSDEQLGNDARNNAGTDSADEKDGASGNETPGKGDNGRDDGGKSRSRGGRDASGSGEQAEAEAEASERESGADGEKSNNRDKRNSTNQGEGKYEEGRDHTPVAGDEAKYREERGNAEYAEKSTNLVLDYLRDQKENPDPELLDKMNWTDEDLREFVNRWEKLKKESTDESGKRKWNDAIKSLGLKPATGNSRQTNRKDDNLGGNAESGGRSQPPEKYLRQFKAFRKSAAKDE